MFFRGEEVWEEGQDLKPLSEQKGNRSASNWQKTISVARILLSVYTKGDSINCPQGAISICINKKTKVLGRTDLAIPYTEVRLNMALVMCWLESSQLWCD